MAWLRRFGRCAVGLGPLLLAPEARAAGPREPAPSVDTRTEAARKFAEGTRAFDSGDYRRAGEAYEVAYSLAPHEDPLWNAARAWHRAGELAHAANLYAHYLREAPVGAPDRASATAALTQLGAKLARIEVHLQPGVEDARLDDTPIEAPMVYVIPGTHLVTGRSTQGEVASRETVTAGATVSVSLAPPQAQSPAPIPPAPDLPPPAVTPPESSPHASPRSGWSPPVVFVEGGLTLLVTGVAVWSGLDTLSTLHAFEAAPNSDRLDQGRAHEVRTNVLIGASIGLAAVTAATALWLVDWGGGRGMTVGLGAAAVSASGRF